MHDWRWRCEQDREALRRVILESPYAGEAERNVAYARRCVRDCLQRNEAPIASHLFGALEGKETPGRRRDLDHDDRRGAQDLSMFFTGSRCRGMSNEEAAATQEWHGFGTRGSQVQILSLRPALSTQERLGGSYRPPAASPPGKTTYPDFR